jgi:uncharacterized membrane protein
MELLASSSPAAAPRTRISWPNVLCGIAGAGVSLYSVKLHNIVKAGDSACDISSTISCDKVLGSAWAAPFGVPLGFFGAFFFALVVLTAISTSPQVSVSSWTRSQFVLSSLGLLGSLAMIFISKVIIGAWCPVCMATHAVVLANFLFAARKWSRARRATGT